jgi:hypothetical protein
MTAMTISWMPLGGGYDEAAPSRRLHHCAMSHTTMRVVINPIVVRIALDCGVAVSAETARVREVLVRRMG